MGTERDGHRYFEGMAVAHVLGGLGEHDGRLFRSHLLECSDCRARVGELRALAHDLADVERDERRVRIPATVETKPREPDESSEEGPSAPPAPARPFSPWVPRVIGLVGLLALLGLAGWNFMLRGTLANQEAAVETMTEASALLQFGEEAEITSILESVDATVGTDGERLALLVDGLESGASFQVFLLNADGDVVDSDTPVVARHERLFLLLPVAEDAARLVVSPAPDGPTAQPRGQPIMAATLPSAQR